MAFNEIQRGEFQGRTALVDTVKFHAKNGVAHIRISNDIYKRLGAPMFMKVMLGSGQHVGLVAFVPRNVPSKGTYKVHTSANGRGLVHLSISPNKVGLPASGASELPFEITDDGLVVDIRSASPIRAVA